MNGLPSPELIVTSRTYTAERGTQSTSPSLRHFATQSATGTNDDALRLLTADMFTKFGTCIRQLIFGITDPTVANFINTNTLLETLDLQMSQEKLLVDANGELIWVNQLRKIISALDDIPFSEGKKIRDLLRLIIEFSQSVKGVSNRECKEAVIPFFDLYFNYVKFDTKKEKQETITFGNWAMRVESDLHNLLNLAQKCEFKRDLPKCSNNLEKTAAIQINMALSKMDSKLKQIMPEITSVVNKVLNILAQLYSH